jgi:hypothetical protein
MSKEGSGSLDLPAQLLMAPGIGEATLLPVLFFQNRELPSTRGTPSLVLLICGRLRVPALWPRVENALNMEHILVENLQPSLLMKKHRQRANIKVSTVRKCRVWVPNACLVVDQKTSNSISTA